MLANVILVSISLPSTSYQRLHLTVGTIGHQLFTQISVKILFSKVSGYIYLPERKGRHFELWAQAVLPLKFSAKA